MYPLCLYLLPQKCVYLTFLFQIIQHNYRQRRVPSKVFRDSLASEESPLDLKRKFIIQFPADDAPVGHAIHGMASVCVKGAQHMLMYF